MQKVKKVIDVEKNVPKETAEMLERYREEFNKQIRNGTSRKERLEALMVRHSAKKWSPEKRSKMIRRHQAAVSQIDSAAKLIDQINLRMEQLATEAATEAQAATT